MKYYGQGCSGCTVRSRFKPRSDLMLWILGKKLAVSRPIQKLVKVQVNCQSGSFEHCQAVIPKDWPHIKEVRDKNSTSPLSINPLSYLNLITKQYFGPFLFFHFCKCRQTWHHFPDQRFNTNCQWLFTTRASRGYKIIL